MVARAAATAAGYLKPGMQSLGLPDELIDK
jgi:hypothetical protein